MNFSQVVFQKTGRLEGTAADVAGDHLARAGAVHEVVVPLGAAKAGKGLGAGQALAAETVRQPGNTHVARCPGHWTCKDFSQLSVRRKSATGKSKLITTSRTKSQSGLPTQKFCC